MLHEPATPAGKDPAGPYKARLGIWMFVLYSVFYASFVAINLLDPLAMAASTGAGRVAAKSGRRPRPTTSRQARGTAAHSLR